MRYKSLGVIGSGKGSHFQKSIEPVLKKGKFFKIEGFLKKKNLNRKKFFAEKEFFKKKFDFVYIACPSQLHEKYIIKSLNAGFNVICEKPFIINKDKLKTIINLSKKNNKLIFESFMYMYHPLFKLIEKIMKDKVYGKLRYLKSNWKHPSLKKFNNQYDKSRGNGFWFDGASYLLSFDNFFFKKKKKIMKQFIKKDIMLRGNFICESNDTKRYYFWGEGQSYKNNLEIFFEKATIYVEQFFAKRLSDVIKLRIYKNFSVKEILVKNENQFYLMFKNIYLNYDKINYQNDHRDRIIHQCCYLLK